MNVRGSAFPASLMFVFNRIDLAGEAKIFGATHDIISIMCPHTLPVSPAFGRYQMDEALDLHELLISFQTNRTGVASIHSVDFWGDFQNGADTCRENF